MILHVDMDAFYASIEELANQLQALEMEILNEAAQENW